MMVRCLFYLHESGFFRKAAFLFADFRDNKPSRFHTFLRIGTKNMPLFLPRRRFRRITDITADYLNENGIRALILDVDNTLSTHHSQTPLDGVDGWLRYMESRGIKLLILSNSKRERVEPFAKLLSLDFLPMGCKPLPFGLMKAKRRLGFKASETAMIGDQIFTDMIGANLCGMHTILLEPILLEDGRGFKFKRRLEKPFIARYERKYGNGR